MRSSPGRRNNAAFKTARAVTDDRIRVAGSPPRPPPPSTRRLLPKEGPVCKARSHGEKRSTEGLDDSAAKTAAAPFLPDAAAADDARPLRRVLSTSAEAAVWIWLLSDLAANRKTEEGACLRAIRPASNGRACGGAERRTDGLGWQQSQRSPPGDERQPCEAQTPPPDTRFLKTLKTQYFNHAQRETRHSRTASAAPPRRPERLLRRRREECAGKATPHQPRRPPCVRNSLKRKLLP